MSDIAYKMAEEVQLSAERANGVLRMITEYVTNPELKERDENLYYALEAACREIMYIRKTTEDYMDMSSSVLVQT